MSSDAQVPDVANGAPEIEPSAKRQKLGHSVEDDSTPSSASVQSIEVVDNSTVLVEDAMTVEDAADAEATPTKDAFEDTLLPPSRVLLGVAPSSHAQEASLGHTLEFDVGISEYISKDLPAIHAIIKQRFTDFLVNEVNQDGEVIHIKSLEMPNSELKKTSGSTTDGVATKESKRDVSVARQPEGHVDPSSTATSFEVVENLVEVESPNDETEGSWSEQFASTLSQYLSESLIAQLKQMYEEGPEPPFVSDSGWSGRQAKAESGGGDSAQAVPTQENKETQSSASTRGKRGKRGRDRGGRGGGGRGGRDWNKPVDTRKVISEPMESKTARTGLHKAIRELFKGKLESETDTKSNEDGDDRIVIKWARRGQGRDAGRGGRGNREEKAPRGTYPPYIHFTLQKTNRDTQDALGHLSRQLRCSVKELSFAGTKDKRGVTVQRVSLRRNGKSVEDVWKLANGQMGRRTLDDALTQRGERGVRISDLNYRKSGLELGMLKGNVFVITLRNVQVEPLDTLDKAMTSLKHKGFINYYGMQRFGTASIPTHSIGLALLQSDWHKAVSLLLRRRPGEHPDVAAARDAWLVKKDLDKALEFMPRRVVAERCILESYKKQKGDTRNAMGALSTIPRNLRLMYVHAYQSYVWNAIVSERIRTHGTEKAVPGDLVFEKEYNRFDGDADDEAGMDDDDDSARPSGKSRKPWVAPRVKTLTEEDANKYSIFDVLMPLPGIDVAYPGGALGERYREFLRLDGLDPDNFVRKQKEYCLTGSYRRILQVPKELSWSILRYTDPDVPLAQSDEDKLLGFEPPVVDENGKFVALQVALQLGTASYATMALREITKTETSSHYQTTLTQSSEDQAFRGSLAKPADEMEV